MPEATADQAPVQSVEDRIYAKFEAETPEHQLAREDAPEAEEVEATAESVEPEPELVEVEYNGQMYQVPKELSKGILQEADYTRKTQEVATQRKMLEQSLSTVQLMNQETEFHQAVAEETHNLKVMDNYIRSLKAQNFNDMTAEDGFRQWMLIQQANDQREALSKSIESKHKEFRDTFQRSVSEAKAKTHDLLSKTINGYTPKAFEAVKEYARGQGFVDGVLDSIETDPKASAVLYKAMRFDQLQAEKASAVKKLDAPVIKPGSAKPMPDSVKEKLNYRNALKSARTRDERNAITQKRVEAMFD
jgi:hypothetical protein